MILPPLVLFGVLARLLAFVQDDAYIYFRYVANAVAGHGLVFNPGQHVEGFTSPSWLAILLLARLFTSDVIAVARGVGLLFGATLIVLAFLFGRRFTAERPGGVGLATALVVAASPALAYWAGAGLETSLYCFLFGLCLWLFLNRSGLLAAGLAALLWTRPEGPLVMALLLVAEMIVEKSVPRYTTRCAIIAALMWLPGLLFRYWYFHSWFPNPFYAKVPFDYEQLISGLGYGWELVRDYPYYLIGLIAPVVRWRHGDDTTRSLWLVTIGYALSVILIGGDTLKVHRFFLPLLLPLAFLTVDATRRLVARVPRLSPTIGTMATVLLLCTASGVRQWERVVGSAERERALTYNMAKLFAGISKCDAGSFSIAATTIGAFGYHAQGHELIDMLGLTDTTVARHPENLPTGSGSTWKERKFNAAYVLNCAPDYIVFSTGIKPSAPAERALLRYPQFLDSYRPMFYAVHLYPDTTEYVLDVAFRKVRPASGPPAATYPVEFVEQFYEGEGQISAGNLPAAMAAFDRAQAACGERKPWVDLLYRKATCLMMMSKGREAYLLLSQILAQDSLAVGPHRDLYVSAMQTGNRTKALLHRAYLERLTPCELPLLDSIAQTTVSR